MDDSVVPGRYARWPQLIFAVALAVRAIELWELEGTALLDFVLGDGKNYVAWGLEIAEGNWLGDETFYQAPLYPYFLGVLFSWLGEDLFLVRIFQLFVGAGSCTLLTLAGWHFFSKRVGVAAGLMLALYAPAFYADAMIQKSVLDIFLICLSLWFLSRAATQIDPHAWLGLGLALGTMTLSRENALVFPFVLIPWLALRPDLSRRQRLTFTALFLTGIIFVLLPVAARNWVVGGEFHLTTSQFGHNFYIGNNPAADGTYKPLIAGRGDPRIEQLDAIKLAESALGRKLAPSEVSSFYAERAFRYIREDPIDWLFLMLRKVMLVMTSVEMVDTEDQYTHAESSIMLHVAGTLFHFGVLAPLAVLGVIVSWPRRRVLLPLYLSVASYSGSLLIFYVFARYRLPLVPFLALFAGAGVTMGRAYLRRAPKSLIARTAVAVSVVALVCNWPIADKKYMRSVTHYNLGNELAGANRVGEAIIEYRHAITLHAGNALATHNLGALLAGQGDLLAAESQYRQALRINPNYVMAHLNLARTLFERGDEDGAIEHFGLGLALEPYRAEAQSELGKIYASRGEWPSAIDRFETALGARPDLEEARSNLARARIELSRKVERKMP